MVAEALKAYVLRDDTIEWIADMVMAFAQKFREEGSELDCLQTRLDESQKASANILRAIEAGIFNDRTQARMLELEAEQRELIALIAEEQALLPHVTRAQIVCWLQSFKDGDVQSSAFRAKLFDAFLLAVYLYDDHIRIAFDWDGGKKSVNLPASVRDWADDAAWEDTEGCVRIGDGEGHLVKEPLANVSGSFALFPALSTRLSWPLSPSIRKTDKAYVG